MIKRKVKHEHLICGHKDHENPEELCKPGYSCYINSPEHYNCFMVYKYFINHQHTLQEVANLLGMSHTTVKAIEDNAKSKIRDRVKREKSDTIWGELETNLKD